MFCFFFFFLPPSLPLTTNNNLTHSTCCNKHGFWPCVPTIQCDDPSGLNTIHEKGARSSLSGNAPPPSRPKSTLNLSASGVKMRPPTQRTPRRPRPVSMGGSVPSFMQADSPKAPLRSKSTDRVARGKRLQVFHNKGCITSVLVKKKSHLRTKKLKRQKLFSNLIFSESFSPNDLVQYTISLSILLMLQKEQDFLQKGKGHHPCQQTGKGHHHWEVNLRRYELCAWLEGMVGLRHGSVVMSL